MNFIRIGLKKRMLKISVGIFTGIFFTCFILSPAENQEISEKKFSPEGRLILVILDFESLSCSLCLESFKAFCETLESYSAENFALGILIFKALIGEEDTEKFEKIIEKQLRGFMVGNNIQFPILLDKLHVFQALGLNDTGIILFDFSRNLLKKYTFPLSQKQLDEIFLH